MKNSPPHSCNILFAGSESRQLWQFNTSNGEAAITAENQGQLEDPLTAKWAAKNWSSLWQKKCNVAWLPSGQAFLRVIHLPVAERGELMSMVELQLEKLSPLPVAQIVWSCEFLSVIPGNLQTVMVLIAARNQVEEFLGKLESHGYLADRLELPLLHQLLATLAPEDGVWMYPSNVNGQHLCLAAWWSGGVLQNVNLLHLSTSPNWPSILKEQLTQIAWAGEIEGWLAGKPHCRLVAEDAMARDWAPVLSEWAGETVQTVPALASPDLAKFSAQRLARSEAQGNLLPAEFASRQRQLFVDRLWMGGLGGVVAIYLVGLLIYFTGLQVVRFQEYRVVSKINALSQQYTNAMQLKERVHVLQEQVDLRYAALECWRAAAVLLPTELQLTSLSLQQGKHVLISGTAAADQVNQIINYSKALMDYHMYGPDGPLLFSKVNTFQSSSAGAGAGQGTVNWNFTCELRSSEIE